MVKIFIGNVAQDATKEEIEALFIKYGTVTECAKYKNYAFVHMEDRKCSTKAMRELHLHRLHGRPINVELSRSKDQGPVKLHIANVEKGFDKELRELFEEYGTVGECAIVKNFAFVHMNNSEEAMDAIKGLDNTEFQGKRIHVQISKSRPRGPPEEEEEEEYPPPPVRGYYPAHMGGERPPPPPYAARMSAFPPPPPPPPVPRRPGYLERSYGGPDGYVFDYYERYRAHPYGASAYDDRRPGAIPPPPPPPSAVTRERLPVSAIDPYERRTLPPPPPAYAARDRSPLRRLPSAAAAGNGYAYERARLSPVARAPMYPPPRPRDPYAERAAQPPPPVPRYAGY